MTGKVLKSAASALAVTALLSANPAAAQYATGGSGQYRSQILWFSWGNISTEVDNAGLTKTNTYTVAGQTLTVTCSLSGITGTRANGSHFDVYAAGGWKGDGLDDLYNIGGTGGSNQLATGLRNASNGARAEGNIACSATYAGVPYTLEGLVFADAEATAVGSLNVDTGALTGEGLGITLPNATTFRFIEQYSANCNTVVGTANAASYTVNASAVGSDKTRYTFTAPNGNCEENGTGPMGIGFIDGATEASFYVQGGGSQAIALGVMTYIADLGDAPSTYGSPSHIPQFTWEGGEVARGTSVNIFSPSFALAKPLEPLIRLGATVDVETIDAYSTTARNDDTRGLSDEDALPGDVTTRLLGPGDRYTLENVLCTATPMSAPVYGFIDFNRDGDFLDAGERSDLAMCSGEDSSVDLTWTVPANMVGGMSYLRLRTAALASQIETPTGVAIQGEVEDYQIFLTAAQIKLVKQVNGRVNPADQFTVEIVENGATLASAVTTGTGGGTNATAQTDLVNATPGGSVILRETVSGGGALTAYDRALSCVAGLENRVALAAPIYDTNTGAWTLPMAQGNDVVCTLTNTGKPHIAVTKTTQGGFGGAFNFTATNLNGAVAPITTTANATASPVVPSFLTPLSLTAPIAITEVPFAGYQISGASCVDEYAANTGNAATVATMTDPATGQVTIPAEALRAGARITCNFVNDKNANLQLAKSLPLGRYVEGNQFDLDIALNDTVVASTTTTGTNSATGAAASVANVSLRQAYVLSEAAAGTPLSDLSRYQATWSCTNLSQVAGAQTPSGTGTTFSVTPQAGDDLRCTISNTRAVKADLSMSKTNTLASGAQDQANDYLLPNTDTTYVLSITNNGPDAVSGAQVYDPAPESPLSCPATEVVACTGGGCPAGPITLRQLQIAPGLTLGTMANGETLTLSYRCRVQ